MVNSVTLIGHTGGVPDVRRLENGTPVANISIVTSEKWKDANGEIKEQSQWHRLICWRQSAELAEKLLTEKGILIYVDGKIAYHKYTDSNGVEKQSTNIIVNSFRLLSSKKEGSRQETSNESNEPTKSESSKIFETFTPYQENTIYIVVEGEQKGKKVFVKKIEETRVVFDIDGAEKQFPKETFEQFYKKMKKLEPVPISDSVLNGDKPADDDLPF